MKLDRVQHRCLLLAVSLGLAAPGAAQTGWFYTLGVEKRAQQAQFCTVEAEVRALADLFRNKGARAGYFALEQIYDCSVRLATFTPVETLETVLVPTEGSDYLIYFVRVRLRDGATSYLVTTRDVKDQ